MKILQTLAILTIPLTMIGIYTDYQMAELMLDMNSLNDEEFLEAHLYGGSPIQELFLDYWLEDAK